MTYTLPKNKHRRITGLERFIIEKIMLLKVFGIAWNQFQTISITIKTLWNLEKLRKAYSGRIKVKKIAKVDGRYFWYNHMPGYPSKAFNRYFARELNLMSPSGNEQKTLRSVIFSITNKCAYQCEHCYAWDNLNQPDLLESKELISSVLKFQDMGVTQIYFTGGEPMNRFKALESVLSAVKDGTDFWLITSGYSLNYERAMKLKGLGLTGVSLSLDHFDSRLHDRFRGFKGAFDWVIKAAENSCKSNLMLGVNLCATREFVTWDNLMEYARLSKTLGVQFILIMEPMAVGHYYNKKVELQENHLKLLEKFYQKMNCDPTYSEFPSVIYHGYHQRRIGCLGSGNRYIYVDTNGDIHPCPFCKSKCGNIKDKNWDESISRLKSTGCLRFKFNKSEQSQLYSYESIN